MQRSRSTKVQSKYLPVPGVYHVFLKEESSLPLRFYFNSTKYKYIHRMEEQEIKESLNLLNKAPGWNHKPVEMYIEAFSIQQQFLSNCNLTKLNEFYGYNGKRNWYCSSPKLITQKVNLCEKIAKYILPEYVFTKIYEKYSSKAELAYRFNSLLEVFKR